MCSVNLFLCQKLVILAGVCSFWINNYLLPLLSSMAQFLLSIEDNVGRNCSHSDLIFLGSQEGNSGLEAERGPDCGQEAEQAAFKSRCPTDRVLCEGESTQYGFKFKFATYNEFSRSKGTDSGIAPMSMVEARNEEMLSFMDIDHMNHEPERTADEEMHQKLNCSTDLEVPETSDQESFFPMDSDSESTTWSDHLRLVMSHLVDSYTDGYLSDGISGDFEPLASMDSEQKTDQLSTMKSSEESNGYDDDDVMKEIKSFLQVRMPISNSNHLESIGEDASNDHEKPQAANSKGPSSEDSSNKLESLWEHLELVEQLKMELQKVRDMGLSTMLGESECSAEVIEGLKPLKIDEMLTHGDCMDELHNFYMNYGERMRKFDILNYQKMCAVGFLQQQENSIQSIPNQRYPTTTTISSMLSKTVGLIKHRNHEVSEAVMEFMKELRADLELVYVAHMCLSWEILQWQYEKALDLQGSECKAYQFNQVAEEFQQFQVLVQRFVENEPFRGPRIDNYNRSRCVLRNLLQVPLVREDKTNMGQSMGKGECAITGDVLVAIVEESIRTFWSLVRADKDCTILASMGQRETPLKFENASDPLTLMELQKTLKEKERKLKDILRSGNSLWKKFRKSRKDCTDQVISLSCQVTVRLVTRVLNMSRITTDQMIWCREKLHKIRILNGEISVEPSFLLFPC